MVGGTATPEMSSFSRSAELLVPRCDLAPPLSDLGPADFGPADFGGTEGRLDLGLTDFGPAPLALDLGPTDLGAAAFAAPDLGPPDLGPADLGTADFGPELFEDLSVEDLGLEAPLPPSCFTVLALTGFLLALPAAWAAAAGRALGTVVPAGFFLFTWAAMIPFVRAPSRSAKSTDFRYLCCHPAVRMDSFHGPVSKYLVRTG